MSERYTPGHGPAIRRFMGRRSAETHAAFFLPLLARGMRLLDCGCGPGSITAGLARRAGETVGVDAVAHAEEWAMVEGVRFERAAVTALPFADGSFDAVFAHALLEHLADPGRAVREMARVLRPGGWMGVRSPDWGGFLVGPGSVEVERALAGYESAQRGNGGNPRVGRELPRLLREAGLTGVRGGASYEVYPDPPVIAEYLAAPLGEADAAAWRRWGAGPDAVFAQAWGEATGRKPGV